jgi:hypothetical protein
VLLVTAHRPADHIAQREPNATAQSCAGSSFFLLDDVPFVVHGGDAAAGSPELKEHFTGFHEADVPRWTLARTPGAVDIPFGDTVPAVASVGTATATAVVCADVTREATDDATGGDAAVFAGVSGLTLGIGAKVMFDVDGTAPCLGGAVCPCSVNTAAPTRSTATTPTNLEHSAGMCIRLRSRKKKRIRTEQRSHNDTIRASVVAQSAKQQAVIDGCIRR